MINFNDPEEREKFFDKKEESLWNEITGASKGFDWTDERGPFDALFDALPGGLMRAFPADVSDQFATAQHEALRAFRSLLEYWIKSTEPTPPPPGGGVHPLFRRSGRARNYGVWGGPWRRP